MASRRVAHAVAEAQSDKANKRVPMEERIAAMLIRSAYRDIRDGFGGRNPGDLGDQAVAGALGIVATKEGRLAPLVLETHYGCTLMHLQAIRREWEHQQTPGPLPHEVLVRMRFAGELAIRQFAGNQFGRSQLDDYAHLIATTRSALQRRVQDAEGWLTSIRDRALDALKGAMGKELEKLQTRKMEEAARAAVDSSRRARA